VFVTQPMFVGGSGAHGQAVELQVLESAISEPDSSAIRHERLLQMGHPVLRVSGPRLPARLLQTNPTSVNRHRRTRTFGHYEISQAK
jgi:hypothetical protein